MLHKSKSRRSKQLKLLIVLPLLGLFIMSFNTKDIYVEVPSNEYNLMEDLLKQSEVVEIIITKNTSDDDLASIKKDLEDKGFTFEYNGVKRNSEGEITAISVEFSNGNSSSKHKVKGNNGIKSFKFTGSDKSMDISGMEDGNTFTYSNNNGTKTVTTATSKVIVIDDEDSDTTIDVQTYKGKDSTYVVKKSNSYFFSTEGDETKFVIRENSDEPLFIIDGEPVKKSIFEDVDSDDIESVFILKGNDAISKYGKSGENGVVIMKKKSGDNIFIESESDGIIMESTNKFVIENDGDGSPMIIVDDVIVEEKIVKDLDPSKIHSVEVLKDAASVKIYGERGKDGVIKITTSKKNGINSEEDKIVIVEKVDSDFHETHEIMLTKNATDSELNLKKQQLKSMGIDAKFSKVRRNKAGEITSIKITLDDNKGRVSTSSWREKTQTIPDIVLGKRGEKLFIQADR